MQGHVTVQRAYCVYFGHVWEFYLDWRRASYGGSLLQTRVGNMLMENAEINSLAGWRIRNQTSDLSLCHIKYEL